MTPIADGKANETVKEKERKGKIVNWCAGSVSDQGQRAAWLITRCVGHSATDTRLALHQSTSASRACEINQRHICNCLMHFCSLCCHYRALFTVSVAACWRISVCWCLCRLNCLCIAVALALALDTPVFVYYFLLLLQCLFAHISLSVWLAALEINVTVSASASASASLSLFDMAKFNWFQKDLFAAPVGDIARKTTSESARISSVKVTSQMYFRIRSTAKTSAC